MAISPSIWPRPVRYPSFCTNRLPAFRFAEYRDKFPRDRDRGFGNLRKVRVPWGFPQLRARNIRVTLCSVHPKKRVSQNAIRFSPFSTPVKQGWIDRFHMLSLLRHHWQCELGIRTGGDGSGPRLRTRAVAPSRGGAPEEAVRVPAFSPWGERAGPRWQPPSPKIQGGISVARRLQGYPDGATPLSSERKGSN